MSETTDGRGSPSAFISHSINGEDALIRRVFAGRSNGFFVDVGAEHPIDGNDFYALYRDGWRGINVEPNPEYFRLLQRERADDRNVQALLSDAETDDAAFFIVPGTGLSTMAADRASLYAERGQAVERVTLRATTLASLLAEIDPPPIDVLKIDVEGAEEAILRGNDWSRFRPALVMVEATLPETPVRRQTGIAAFLADQGYRFAYHDGLNDFYVEGTFSPPADAFRAPNLFDNVVTAEVVSLRDNFAASHAYASSLEDEKRSLSAAASAKDNLITALYTLTTQLLSGEPLEVETVLKDRSDASDVATPVERGDEAPSRPTAETDLSPELRLGLAMAHLDAVLRENRRFAERVKNLEFESRRLDAGNRELHGERLALHRALDQARADARVVGEARSAIDAVRSLASTAEAATVRQAEILAARQPAIAPDVPPSTHPDTERLRAVYNSTSWRLTRPMRVIGRLLKRLL